MSLEFLEVDAAAEHAGRVPVARSPMERETRAAGARFAVRAGWSVATGYGAAPGPVGWADVSHLGKLEVQGDRDDLARLVDGRLELGRAVRADGAWWCLVWPEKLLVLGAAPALRHRLEGTAASVVDVTCAHGALVIVGPHARETLARFCALDLRSSATPVGGFRPGSVARTPGYVLREAEDRFLVLFGAALGHYLWTQVADAAGHLGGAPLGVDDLEELAPDA